MAKKIIPEIVTPTTIIGALSRTGSSGVNTQEGGEITIIVHKTSSGTTKKTPKMKVKS